eukprot:13536053-Alexandrium_andersonii.AAC.1
MMYVSSRKAVLCVRAVPWAVGYANGRLALPYIFVRSMPFIIRVAATGYSETCPKPASASTLQGI